MSYNYEEKLSQFKKLNYSQKLTIARADYEAIMSGVDPNWKITCSIYNGSGESCPPISVRTGIQILAALIAFGDDFFTESERIFVAQTIDLTENEAYIFKKSGKKYFLNAVSVFQQFLGEAEQEKLIEIMLILATIDGQLSKRELKWIKKLLMFIL